jgi:uncharacterized protein
MSQIHGYAIVFDSDSHVLAGSFIEQIAPSAVTRTLQQGSLVQALVAHDVGKPLARTDNGTLVLRADTRGLHAVVGLPDTSYARDLIAARAHGTARGWSFAFRAREDLWTVVDDIPRRRVTDMDISEVSPGVAFCAYPATEAAGRSDAPSLDVARDAHREAAGSVARIIRALACDHPDVRLACTYRDGRPDIRLLDSPRPGWRLHLAKARQRLAMVS